MPCARAVLAKCSQGDDMVCAVHIYGELFGGKYPHPDVAPIPRLRPVQNGVWYCPNINFMAFDVCVQRTTEVNSPEPVSPPACSSATTPTNSSNHPGVPSSTRQFLDFFAAAALCSDCGLEFVVPLQQGTLQECLAVSIEFSSTVHAQLGLPALADNNLAEGVVVRACKERKARGQQLNRAMFKRKILAFSEKQYRNDDWRMGKQGGAGRQANAPGPTELLKWELLALCTSARVQAVVSKIGRINTHAPAEMLALLKAFKKDLLQDLQPAERLLFKQTLTLRQALQSEAKGIVGAWALEQRRPAT